jgi:hypothetical protein
MFEFEFSYDSDRLAEIKDLNHCPSVFVTIHFNIYEETCSTPLGPDKRWAVDGNLIESVHADGFGDVTSLKDTDIDFLEEITKQIEKREPQMVDFARGKM